jgi:hypothetical protein
LAMFSSAGEARAAGSLPRLRTLSQHLLQERIASIHARAAEEQEGGGGGGGGPTGAHTTHTGGPQRSSAGTRRLTQELESVTLLRRLLAEIPDMDPTRELPHADRDLIGRQDLRSRDLIGRQDRDQSHVDHAVDVCGTRGDCLRNPVNGGGSLREGDVGSAEVGGEVGGEGGGEVGGEVGGEGGGAASGGGGGVERGSHDLRGGAEAGGGGRGGGGENGKGGARVAVCISGAMRALRPELLHETLLSKLSGGVSYDLFVYRYL